MPTQTKIGDSVVCVRVESTSCNVSASHRMSLPCMIVFGKATNFAGGLVK